MPDIPEWLEGSFQAPTLGVNFELPYALMLDDE